MSRLLPIDDCRECKHCTEHTKTEFLYCMHQKIMKEHGIYGRIIYEKNTAPDWCPLEEVK